MGFELAFALTFPYFLYSFPTFFGVIQLHNELYEGCQFQLKVRVKRVLQPISKLELRCWEFRKKVLACTVKKILILDYFSKQCTRTTISVINFNSWIIPYKGPTGHLRQSQYL